MATVHCYADHHGPEATANVFAISAASARSSALASIPTVVASHAIAARSLGERRGPHGRGERVRLGVAESGVTAGGDARGAPDDARGCDRS